MADTIHIACGDCGVEFCLPSGLYHARKKDGRTFYCPNGHGRCYRPTEDEKTIADLEKREASLKRVVAEWRDRWEEVYTAREELIGVLRECPGHCGWKSAKRIARDPVAMGRGIERVQRDVAEHLVREHGAGRPLAEQRLLTA